jgi:DNA-binding PadR family transcriptional regulator
MVAAIAAVSIFPRGCSPWPRAEASAAGAVTAVAGAVAIGAESGAASAAAAGELRLVLLKLIADQPRHGYDLIQSIEELTGGDYAPSPGVVYPTLTMLEDMGYIAAQASGETSRKAYAITPEGQAHLEERREEAEALVERLSDLGDRQRRAGGAPINRAVGNLLSALWHRVQRDGINEDTLHQIAEILDEAARKVERS